MSKSKKLISVIRLKLLLLKGDSEMWINICLSMLVKSLDNHAFKNTLPIL